MRGAPRVAPGMSLESVAAPIGEGYDASSREAVEDGAMSSDESAGVERHGYTHYVETLSPLRLVAELDAVSSGLTAASHNPLSFENGPDIHVARVAGAGEAVSRTDPTRSNSVE